MVFHLGMWGSLAGGIDHENRQQKNPKGEWNMDSWNNYQGREIAKEIRREYGDEFLQFSQQKQDDIIAAKVMYKMNNKQLITNPNDSRKFKGFWEQRFNTSKLIDEQGKVTGHAAAIEDINSEAQINQISPKVNTTFTPEALVDKTNPRSLTTFTPEALVGGK